MAGIIVVWIVTYKPIDAGFTSNIVFYQAKSRTRNDVIVQCVDD